MSTESCNVRDAEAVFEVEGHIRSTAMARDGRNPAVSENPSMFVRAAPGPGRSACRPDVVTGPQREGTIRSR